LLHRTFKLAFNCSLSRLLPKLGPLLVWAALGGRRCRSSSHRRSTFHFPFVLSCVSTHLVSSPSFTCCVFNPLFPPCLCVGLFIVVLVYVPRERTMGYFVPIYLVVLDAFGFA
jgi:CHASE2 domain-containing sensor protein